jgi:hypothetical protein
VLCDSGAQSLLQPLHALARACGVTVAVVDDGELACCCCASSDAACGNRRGFAEHREAPGAQVLVGPFGSLMTLTPVALNGLQVDRNPFPLSLHRNFFPPLICLSLLRRL